MSFLGEIKRRKVFQVAAVYAVVAWLLVQIVATVEEPLGLPAWFDTGVIVLLMVGFPIAVILSWAFELIPDGLKSTAGTRSADEVSHASGQRLTFISHGLVLLAVGFLLADQYLLRPGSLSIAVSPEASAPVDRFDYDLPEDQSFRGTGRPVMALSPDGRVKPTGAALQPRLGRCYCSAKRIR